MIEKARYVLFLPLAFCASILFGVIGNWLGNFGIWIYEGSDFLGWVFSGIGSSVSLLFVGMTIAPYKTQKIKWILLSILFFFGITSTLGSFISDSGVKAMAGIVMILIGMASIKIDPKSLTLK